MVPVQIPLSKLATNTPIFGGGLFGKKIPDSKPTNPLKLSSGLFGSKPVDKKPSDYDYSHLPKNVADSLRRADTVKQTEHGYKWSVSHGQDSNRIDHYLYDSRFEDTVWRMTSGSSKLFGGGGIEGSQAYKDAVEKYETEQEYARQKAEAEAERSRQQAIIDAEQRKATALSNQRNALDSIARSDEQGAVVSKPSTVTGDLSGVSVDGEEAGKRRRGKSLTRLLGI